MASIKQEVKIQTLFKPSRSSNCGHIGWTNCNLVNIPGLVQLSHQNFEKIFGLEKTSVSGGQPLKRVNELVSKNGALGVNLTVRMGNVTVEWLTTVRRTFDGTFPGPTWRIKAGDVVTVAVVSAIIFKGWSRAVTLAVKVKECAGFNKVAKKCLTFVWIAYWPRKVIRGSFLLNSVVLKPSSDVKLQKQNSNGSSGAVMILLLSPSILRSCLVRASLLVDVKTLWMLHLYEKHKIL